MLEMMKLSLNQYLIGIEPPPRNPQEFFYLRDEEQSYLEKEIAVRTTLFVRKLAPRGASSL